VPLIARANPTIAGIEAVYFAATCFIPYHWFTDVAPGAAIRFAGQRPWTVKAAPVKQV
jgi:hypothetical protein